MLRLKFRHRAEVVLLRRADATRSFEMFVFDPRGEVVNVGSVSARHFYDQLQPGEARPAEVEYLYSSDGFRLVQPTLVRFRTDKDPRDCGLGQLVVGKRFALAS